jgi:hypothetical protein
MEHLSSKLTKRILVTLLCTVAALIANSPVAVAVHSPVTNHRGLGTANPMVRSDIESTTGVRVLLQVWNPLTPDKNDVVTLVDDPTLVSDSLQDAWMQSRSKICEQLKGRMGVGGAANGQTLSDITCELDQQVVLDVSGGGQNTVRATFLVGGYLEATSTTPGPLGSYADPRVSIAITAKLELTLAVQPNRDQTLHVSQALFSLSNAKLDSHNFTGDVLKFVSDDLLPFFGGANFKRIAEETINKLSIDLAGRFDSALAPVNAKLKGPSDAIRVGVAGSPGYISVAFAPREIPPPTGGSLSGLLRWDPAQFAPRTGCGSFEIRATVQTGPLPMFTANASAPTREVGHLDITPADASTCRFTLSGLAPGWPNVLTTRVVGGNVAARNTGSSIYTVSYSLVGDGWGGRIVTPEPNARGNYVVGRNIDAAAIKTPDYGSAKKVVESKTNPRINPAQRKSDSISLNPQPLPQRANSKATQTKATNPGTTSGIIIVSGQGDPLARKSGVDYSRSAGVDPAVISTGQVKSAEAPNFDRLVTRGAELAKDDQETLELLNQQPEGAVRTGFYIGLAAAEGQTLPGPGKQRIHDSLPADQQEGFAAAVTFSLARNRKKLTDLAPRGAELATQDPLAQQLRSEQVDDATRLGFDIGMAAAEEQTADGPGKKKTHDSLYPAEQTGFTAAVTFSLERNRNAKLAHVGAAIAAADPIVSAARNAKVDVFYRLGFDIASGIFGDPALGAAGNTLTGPGSLKIRDSLSAAGQRGFNASVNLHLSRKYR